MGQTFKDKDGKRQPAIRWLLDLIAHNDEDFGVILTARLQKAIH